MAEYRHQASGSSSGRQPPYLYHYTSRDNAHGIEGSRHIATSKDTTHDAMAGEGVYLTSMPPRTTNQRLLNNNYDDGGSRYLPKNKVQTCFKIPRRDLPDVERVPGERNVYVNREPIHLDNTNYQYVDRDQRREERSAYFRKQNYWKNYWENH